jgi:DNA-binding transcriptional MerR regulator
MSDILLKVEDVSQAVGVAASTIRKYSFLIEKQGYTFSRSNQGALMYDKEEVSIFKEIIQIKKQKNMTLEKAVQRALSNMSDMVDIVDISRGPYDDMSVMSDVQDMSEAIAAMQAQMKAVLDQNEKVLLQNQELIRKVERLEDTSLLEKEKIENRDKLLLDAMKEIKETKKVIATSLEENRKVLQKKWWEFWR